MNRSSFRIFLLLAVFLTVPLAMRADAEGEGWHTDYKAAAADARKSGKAVLLLFTGSDWCPPCMHQEKEVFANAKFKEWAKANVELVFLDFPRRKAQSEKQKQHNNELRAKYGPQGFPTVLILDAEGNEHARWVGYDKKNMDVESWIKRAQGPTKKARG